MNIFLANNFCDHCSRGCNDLGGHSSAIEGYTEALWDDARMASKSVSLGKS